ncbi:class I SAM-dependent methyltransferase [Calditrichota bacterium]
MSQSNDRTLRFYHEVLGLERLHYGMWLPEDELTLGKLKEAQVRYEDFLVEKIPEGVQRILDVGSGTGIMTRRLLDKGYDVEGLSPDQHQMEVFTETLDVPFHHSSFDRFTATSTYDCLLMSESAQYVNMEKLFENARQCLKPNGYLMVCDYFVLENATGLLGKSGHNYDRFMELVEKIEFTVVSNEDITDSVTKTLDIAKDALDRVLLAVDIATEKVRRKRPRLSRYVLWMFRKKIEKGKRQIELLDSAEFKKNKTYRFLLLQAP